MQLNYLTYLLTYDRKVKTRDFALWWPFFNACILSDVARITSYNNIARYASRQHASQRCQTVKARFTSRVTFFLKRMSHGQIRHDRWLVTVARRHDTIHVYDSDKITYQHSEWFVLFRQSSKDWPHYQLSFFIQFFCSLSRFIFVQSVILGLPVWFLVLDKFPWITSVCFCQAFMTHEVNVVFMLDTRHNVDQVKWHAGFSLLDYCKQNNTVVMLELWRGMINHNGYDSWCRYTGDHIPFWVWNDCSSW